jgi:transcriptional regulator with XRE-family HTH domain
MKPRTSRRQGGSEGAAGNPLYLQHLFAANVRIVRTAKGLSQEELAHRASIDRTYVSSVERRLRNVSLQNVQRLALALDVDPRELLSPDLAEDPRYARDAGNRRLA